MRVWNKMRLWLINYSIADSKVFGLRHVVVNILINNYREEYDSIVLHMYPYYV